MGETKDCENRCPQLFPYGLSKDTVQTGLTPNSVTASFQVYLTFATEKQLSGWFYSKHIWKFAI